MDLQTYIAGYIHVEIEALPLVPAVGSNDHDRWASGDQTRSAEVCYTAGLDNAGCANRLRRHAKEEQRGPDPCWNRLKAETTAARSVTGRDYDWVLFGNGVFL